MAGPKRPKRLKRLNKRLKAGSKELWAEWRGAWGFMDIQHGEREAVLCKENSGDSGLHSFGVRPPPDPFAGGKAADSRQSDPPAVLRIRPNAPWCWLDSGELWRYRDLLWSLAFRDLRLRYRQTALGVLWVVFQPLAGAGIFTLVFGWVAGMKSPKGSYFLFSMAGLLTWNAFQSTLTKSSMALLGNASLVSKVYFPRLLLPVSTVLSTLVDLAIGTSAFLVLSLCMATPPGWSACLSLPFWLGLTLASGLGLGLLAASCMTRFRDVQHVLPMALPFLMYVSPVAYSMAAVPPEWSHYFRWSPVAWMLEGTRAALTGGGTVPTGWIAYSAAVSLLLLATGVFSFRRMERSFADVV